MGFAWDIGSKNMGSKNIDSKVASGWILAYAVVRHSGWRHLPRGARRTAICRRNTRKVLAERTGLEPATPGVTGRYSNQLNYRSIGYHLKKLLDSFRNIPADLNPLALNIPDKT